MKVIYSVSSTVLITGSVWFTEPLTLRESNLGEDNNSHDPTPFNPITHNVFVNVWTEIKYCTFKSEIIEEWDNSLFNKSQRQCYKCLVKGIAVEYVKVDSLLRSLVIKERKIRADWCLTTCSGSRQRNK